MTGSSMGGDEVLPDVLIYFGVAGSVLLLGLFWVIRFPAGPNHHLPSRLCHRTCSDEVSRCGVEWSNLTEVSVVGL